MKEMVHGGGEPAAGRRSSLWPGGMPTKGIGGRQTAMSV
ncbi:hypothetical protein AKJ08_0925 [Vulgatibacter incomptus]|uniref:Uncharacterized protein n=1 Tax=Vulgatibacter incomptus TaxID=1391653 RepID=A0A0K1PAH4_9BACT|nr:hypothetical protein AKJ08_0925 [Vulgatibacter incomptus]